MTRILIAAALLAALIVVPTALAAGDGPDPDPGTHTLAVIGDIPYGDALIAEFPSDVAEINADPDVRRVVHLGDIKNGSSRCDTSYFQARLADVERFDAPFVYTPGDNEWTDCHRANNGGYLPTERLDTIRRLFFPRRGITLGRRQVAVRYQSDAFPENVQWAQWRVEFGVVHVVGSNDDQDAWFGDRKDPVTGRPSPETAAETALRVGEYTAREAAALAWIDSIFDAAEEHDSAGVAIGMQADMWDASAPASELTAFAPMKAELADRAARFGKPVLLLQGDSHHFASDKPAGQPANVRRIVVQGSTSVPHEWLRLHVDPHGAQVFSCENVVFVTGAVTACPAPPAP